jgi:hypothetical protein
LETVATGNETVGKISFIRGANTLFEGQQINGYREKRREDTHREKRDTEERNGIEIKGTTRDADLGRSKQQIQRGTRTAQRLNVRGSEHIVKRDCSD